MKSVTHVTSTSGESALRRSFCRSCARSVCSLAFVTGHRPLHWPPPRTYKPPSLPTLTIHPLTHWQTSTPSLLPFCTRRPVSSSEATPYVPISDELLHSLRGSSLGDLLRVGAEANLSSLNTHELSLDRQRLVQLSDSTSRPQVWIL